jgi:hypothetical protein
LPLPAELWDGRRRPSRVGGIGGQRRRRLLAPPESAVAPATGYHRHAERWTEPHIRAALEVYLEGAVAWPTRDMLTADGLGGLLSALERRGGARHWAAEFGLPGGGVVGRASPPVAGWRALRSGRLGRPAAS